MTKYFGFNSLAGCQASQADIVESASAGSFDATFVSRSIFIPGTGGFIEFGAPFQNGDASITGTFYFKLEYHWPSGASGVPIYLWLNALGVNAYRLYSTGAGTTVQFQYWNSGTSAWVNWGASFALSNVVRQVIHMKLVMQTSFEISLGGVVVASGTAPVNASANIATCRIGLTSWNCFASQVMGADYQLLDSHLKEALINANGTATDGTGTYTDINEAVRDDSTAITLTAVGHRKTFTKAAITLPVGYEITGLVANIRGRVSGGVVADGKAAIRSAAAYHDSAVKAFPATYAPRCNIWETDPGAGGAKFSLANFNAAEVGLLAA